MMDMREALFQLGYSLFTEGVKNTLLKKSEIPDSVPTNKSQSQCVGCNIHTEVGQAYLYLLGISQRVDDDAEIPKGVAGTLFLARAHVQKAYAEVAGLMFIDPEIDDHATKLATLLPEIDTRLEHVPNGKEAKQITLMCKDAWETAYCIPEIIYRPRVPEVTQLREEVKTLRQQIDNKIFQEASDAKRAGMDGVTGQTEPDRETTPGT